MKKKTILRSLSLICTLMLTLSLVIPAFAAGNYSAIPSYHDFEGGMLTWDEELKDQIEYFQEHPTIVPRNEYDVMPYGNDPGEGSINTYESGLISDGTLYLDEDRSYDMLSYGANVAVSFLGGPVETVLSVIQYTLDAANIFLPVEAGSPASLVMKHSISYQCRVGEFYHNNQWMVGTDLQRALFFKHTSTTCVINGQTRQVMADFTYDNGYGPYTTSTPAYYNDLNAVRTFTIQCYNQLTSGVGTYEPYMNIIVPHGH